MSLCLSCSYCCQTKFPTGIILYCIVLCCVVSHCIALYCIISCCSQGHHTIDRLEEERRRRKRKRSTIFLERTRKGPSSIRHWNCFKGNIGETAEGQGGAHMGLPERIDTTLNSARAACRLNFFHFMEQDGYHSSVKSRSGVVRTQKLSYQQPRPTVM